MINLYEAGKHNVKYRPGKAVRKRFAQHAYKCMPLATANRHGWDLYSEEKIVVEWNGGPGMDDVKCLEGPGYAHFGQGTFSIEQGYIWRTPKGYDLLFMPVPNSDRMDFYAMTALIETDWLNYPFFVTINLAQPGRVEIPAGTSLARVFAIQRDPDLSVTVSPVPPSVQVVNNQWTDERKKEGDHRLYFKGLQRGNGKVKDPDEQVVVNIETRGNGQYHIVKGFVGPEDCTALSAVFSGGEPDGSFWGGRIMHNPPWPKDVLALLDTVPFLALRVGWPSCWLLNPHMVRWPDGHPGMPPHSDYGGAGEYPHREYAGLIKLNNGYSGGRTLLDGNPVEAQSGDLVLFHGGEILHGVEAVSGANRYTLPFWLADKKKWPEKPE